MGQPSVKHSPLDSLHRRLGARMIEFGGFSMPLSYAGIIAEHLTVREKAGIFDLSHMGEFEIAGPGAVALLERAMTNAASRLADGQSQYTLMCEPSGGVIDDLIVYRLAHDRYLLCVNAANTQTDWEWLSQLKPADAEMRDLSEQTALIALQGPRAEAILGPLADFDPSALLHRGIVQGRIAGVAAWVARTGYTGEDGFELFVSSPEGEQLFTAIVGAGAEAGLVPCGLGARDTLRMEAGLALYGHELDRTTTPLEAGLARFVRFGHNFVGEEALAAQHAAPIRKRLVGLRTTDGRTIARAGHKLYLGKREVGVVTSGTFAPSFGRPLAMAYLRAGEGIDLAAPAGLRVGVKVRQKIAEAELVDLPFYRRARQVAAGGPHS